MGGIGEACRRTDGGRVGRDGMESSWVAVALGALAGVAVLVGVLAVATPAVAQQGAEPPSGCWVRGTRESAARRASPLDSTSAILAVGVVKVCYGRPAMRGRKIMGGLVPYGEPWRLGANEATAIRVPFPATIAGVRVSPGWYSLYVIPGRSRWVLAVNGVARRWGIPISAAVRRHDVGVDSMRVQTLGAPVERLTMTLQRLSPRRAQLRVEWETTRLYIPVEAR